MKFFLTFLIAFAVCGAMFGVNILLQNICYKRKHFLLQGFCMPLVGLVLAVVMEILTGEVSFEFRTLADFRLWLIGLATVAVSCGIVLLARRNQESDVPLGIRCVEAAAMEIPQRVFMQTFICVLLVHMGEKEWCAILINAMVWCAGILVSTLFSKEREWGKIIIEVVSSFAFSIGIGYVFFLSGCFVIPMVAHALERFASVLLEKHQNNTTEVSGGTIDNTYDAPTEIKSKNIEAFKTHFYLWDRFDETAEGGYSFTIKKNDSREYVLSEDIHFNVSVTVDRSVLEKLQEIVDDNSLVKKNGLNRHTSGLPEEYAPCMFSATYDSEEQLYFSEDNNPEAKWAKDIRDLFKEEFIRQGHDELLPPVEDITLIRFDMGYENETDGVNYATIFTEEDTGDVSCHYMTNTCNADTGEGIYEAIKVIPDNFYEDLSAALYDMKLQSYQNGEISPPSDFQGGKNAFFCMEMQSGKQINAYYTGEEAEELIKVLEKVREYIDGRLK